MNNFVHIEGATPIDVSYIIPKHIRNQKQLDEWESANILEATKKYLSRKKKTTFDINFVKEVHHKMFDKTWEWAGKFRQINLNFGVDKHKILEDIKKLMDDIKYWQSNNNNLNILEQSVRIHHRLVFIHPFHNGNGRHARLMADIYLYAHGHSLPNWPDAGKIRSTNIRHKYIETLKAADKGDYNPLEKFTRELI